MKCKPIFSNLRLLLTIAIALPNLYILQTPILAKVFSTTPTQNSQNSDLICPTQLGDRLDQIINRPQFRRSRWGILIQPLNSSQTLYSRDAEKYFIPASNAKLLVTAAILHQLRPDYRLRTSVYGDSTNLTIVGRGDPSLDDAQLTSLARQLHRRGIRNIDRLIAEDSYFQEDLINPTWEWSDVQAGYAARVNSLIVNENAIAFTLFPQALGEPLRVVWDNPSETLHWKIENQSQTVAANKPEFIEVGRDLQNPILRVKGQLRVGSLPEPASVAVIDPARNFLQHFRRQLATEGIAVSQTSIKTTPQIPSPEIAAIESPPLSELLVETNRWSNNLYAEALLRILRANNHHTSQTSLEIVKQILTELGVNPDSYLLADAAGLSRHNLVSPQALVQTLQVMAKSKDAEIYRASLAVASGNEGSLRNRFQQTAAAGKLWGKTGSLTGVAALSGYLEVPSYNPLVFSIIVNQVNASGGIMIQAIDEIVLQLTRLNHC